MEAQRISWRRVGRSAASGYGVVRPQQPRHAVKLRIDQEDDTLYFHLEDSAIVDSLEVAPGVVLDFNAVEQVIGLEMLSLSARLPGLDLKSLEFEIS